MCEGPSRHKNSRFPLALPPHFCYVPSIGRIVLPPKTNGAGPSRELGTGS